MSKVEQPATLLKTLYLRIGLNVLAIFWVFYLAFPASGASIQKLFVNGLFLLSLTLLTIQFLRFRKKRQWFVLDRTSYLMLLALLAWGLISIARSLSTNSSLLLTLLANPELGGAVWILPAAAFLGISTELIQSLRTTFKFHTLLGIGLSIFALLNSQSLDNQKIAFAGLFLIYAAPVVLLTGIGKPSERLLHFAGMLTGLPAAYLIGSRTSLALLSMLICLVLVFGNTYRQRFILVKLMLFSLIVGVATFAFFDSFLAQLNDEWLLDTRSFLWEEINDDFSFADWLFGRGALGTYYSPFFDRMSQMGQQGGDSMTRQVNEIGYLHVILKTGLVGLVLYVLCMLRGLYCAYRLRQNRLFLAIALFISLHLTEMFVVGQAIFSPYRVILWVMVGVAMHSYSNIKIKKS